MAAIIAGSLRTSCSKRLIASWRVATCTSACVLLRGRWVYRLPHFDPARCTRRTTRGGGSPRGSSVARLGSREIGGPDEHEGQHDGDQPDDDGRKQDFHGLL